MGLLKSEVEDAGLDACTMARDVRSFDLLVEDMETELGERWGGLDFADGLSYLASPEARALEFIAVAVDRTDEEHLDPVIDLIAAAKGIGLKVILVAHDLSPVVLHQLLKLGADDFCPYPLPEGALSDAIARLRQPRAVAIENHSQTGGGEQRNGVLLPVYGLAGGVGATMFAVNLAWEISQLNVKSGLKVAILDLDLQGGSVSTYLDLPRRESIYELLSDTAAMDDESFQAALVNFNEQIDVLTAPADALPLDILLPEDVDRVLDKALAAYDFVVVDMPTTLVHWTETILQRSDAFFALMEIDMRSAQNALRFIRLLKSEDLPIEKVRYVLNRAPKATDLSARGRAKRLAENLNINLDIHLPDGGKQVTNACDHGLPLLESAHKNPLRKEIAKVAGSINALATGNAKVK